MNFKYRGWKNSDGSWVFKKLGEGDDSKLAGPRMAATVNLHELIPEYVRSRYFMGCIRPLFFGSNQLALKGSTKEYAPEFPDLHTLFLFLCGVFLILSMNIKNVLLISHFFG